MTDPLLHVCANTTGSERGFIYTGGVMAPLGSLTGGPSNAYGINDSGQAVGSSVASNGRLHAVLYGPGGSPTDLGTLGGPESHAYAINNNNQIAGYSTLPVTYIDNYGNPYVVEETHAFLYDGSAMNDLGKLSGVTYSYASGINNIGQVVGWSGGNAFLYSGGVMTDLGTLTGPDGGYSHAYGINDGGDVVGAAYLLGVQPDPFHSQPRAFIYSGGVMTNLNTLIDPASGWVLEEARDINESGQIVGWGMHNGQLRAYLLTKLEPNKPPLAQSIAVKTVSGTPLNWQPTVSDPDNGPLSLTCRLASLPPNGTATLKNDCSGGTYQSNPGFVGTDSFTYIANDGQADSNPGTVTVAVTEPPPTDLCRAAHPLTQFSQTGKQGTLTISFTGNIVAYTNKAVKVCPGTTLSYNATSTQDSVKCKVKHNTTSGSGTLRINDEIKCTDKPVGKDKVEFKVKSGVSK